MVGGPCYACGLRSYRKLRPFLRLHRIDCWRWFPAPLFTSKTSVWFRRRPRDVGSVQCDAGEGGGEIFLVKMEGVFKWIYTRFLGSMFAPRSDWWRWFYSTPASSDSWVWLPWCPRVSDRVRWGGGGGGCSSKWREGECWGENVKNWQFSPLYQLFLSHTIDLELRTFFRRCPLSMLIV
jgi:hypothetical protein